MEVKASNQITLMNTDLVDAAKTATNYLGFSSDGLVVGDLTGSTLGKNVLIDSDSVDIRNGNTVLASFAANTISIGNDGNAANINLCERGSISARDIIYTTDILNADGTVTSTSQNVPTLTLQSDHLDISSDVFRLVNKTSDSSNYTLLYSSALTPHMHIRADDGTSSSGIQFAPDYTIFYNHPNKYGSYYLSMDNDGTVVLNGYDVTITGSYVHIDSGFGTGINGTLYASGSVTANTNIYVGSSRIAITGSNKVLWSGGAFMRADQTETLSEAISAQVNGIVLVFCGYDPSTGTRQEWNWNHVYIPKQDVVYNGTTGHTVGLFANAFNAIGYKYLYISDTTITGNDTNLATGTNNGITYANNKFVLRYVIGV